MQEAACLCTPVSIKAPFPSEQAARAYFYFASSSTAPPAPSLRRTG